MYTRKKLSSPPRVVRFDQLTNLQKIKLDLRKHPLLLALRRCGRITWRNVCDSATEITY